VLKHTDGAAVLGIGDDNHDDRLMAAEEEDEKTVDSVLQHDADGMMSYALVAGGVAAVLALGFVLYKILSPKKLDKA
jgi:hypothetical protein